MDDNGPSTSAQPADEPIRAPSPSSVVPTPADTGYEVAKLAGRYMRFTTRDLIRLAAADDTGALDHLTRDIRAMAASLARQNER